MLRPPKQHQHHHHQQQQQKHWSFPQLRAAEIVACLESLDIRLSEMDIQKPSANVMSRLMETIADMFLNYRLGDYQGPCADPDYLSDMLDEMMDNPELHQDSLPLLAFYQRLSQFMRDIGLDSFSVHDVLKPEASKVVVILSAVINFARFREEKLTLFDELNQQSEKYAEEHEQLMKYHQELSEKISQIKNQREEEEPVVEQIKAVNVKLCEQLKDMKASGDAANAEMSRLKHEKSELADVLQNNEIVLNHTKQECTRLRSRIVHNPEQLKQAITDMSSSLQNLKTQMATHEKSARELHAKFENLALVEQDVLVCLKLMEECEVEQRALEEMTQRVSGEKDIVDRKHAELRELNMKEQQLKRQEQLAEEKIMRLHHQISLKRASLDDKLNKLQMEWQTMDSERTNMQEQMDKHNETVNDLREKISALKQQHEGEVSGIQNDFTKLKQQVLKYIGEIRRAMISDDQVQL